MKKTIFIAFFSIICFCSTYGNPYPISPCPLRKLVQESNAIIIGDVINVSEQIIKKKKKNIHYPSYSVARIVIRETLQGAIKKDTIEILFEPNMSCPAPPRFYEKTTVLAFLDFDKGNYRTHALSYGAKTLDTMEVRIYKTRIKEIKDILKIGNLTDKQDATIEWLVKCAENPITRWEGVFELSPESDFMSFYSQDSTPQLKDYLNAEQKERLKKALQSSIEFNYHDFGLSDLIYKDNKEEIDAILFEKLKKIDAKSYWYASNFMTRLKHLKDCPEMENLLKRQSDIEFQYGNDSQRKKIIDEFITLVEN